MQTLQCPCEKASFSDFGVWCLHTRCEMTHFYTLRRCPAPFWLIQCKPYRNRFIIAKVIDKSLWALFYGPLCILKSMLMHLWFKLELLPDKLLITTISNQLRNNSLQAKHCVTLQLKSNIKWKNM